MSSSNKSGFSIFTPEEDAERRMPDHLELIDSRKGGATGDRLLGGAYDPYRKEDPELPGDTVRVRKPRVDLRKLSEWIKATQRVKALRDEELAQAARALSDDKPGDEK